MGGVPLLKVLYPGLLASVQDTGRFTFQKYGYTQSGAMDDFALRVGNRLVGNHETEAGLEITYSGASFLLERDAVIALTGGDLSPRVNDMDIPMWQSLRVEKGSILTLKRKRWGARAYLCLQGGIHVPLVLSSKSTDLKCSFGGYQGRKLKTGDILEGAGGPLDMKYCHRYFPYRIVESHYRFEQDPAEIRVTLGPDKDHYTEEGYKTLLSSVFTISEKMDRQGYQLQGPRIEHSVKGPNIVTNFTPLGALQVPGIGTPILLMKDRQTSGGYAKIANAIFPDISRLAQKFSGDRLSFKAVGFEEAHDIFREYEETVSTTPLGVLRDAVNLRVVVRGKEYTINIGEVEEDEQKTG